MNSAVAAPDTTADPPPFDPGHLRAGARRIDAAILFGEGSDPSDFTATFGNEADVSELASGVIGPFDQRLKLRAAGRGQELIVRFAGEGLGSASVLPLSGSTNAGIELVLFGRPHLVAPRGPIGLPGGRSLAILASLASASPASMSPEALARFAWPENAAGTPNAVYTAISRLRHSLEGKGVADLITRDSFGYRLGLDPGAVDLVRFEQQANELVVLGDDVDLQSLTKLLAGDATTVFREGDSVLLDRWVQRLSGLRARLTDQLARSQAQNEQLDAAIATCRQILETEPCREVTWLMLIACLYRSGRPNDSLSAFADARVMLRDELGLDPGPALQELELRILSHDTQLLGQDWLDTLSLT